MLNNRAHPAPPAARQDDILVQEIGNEAVVYDARTQQAHALGVLAAAVFAGSDGRRSIAELALFASERVGESINEVDVWDALVQLEEHDLLQPPTGEVSRRAFVKSGAAAIAFSAPLLTSIAMPSIAAAASCLMNKSCTVDADCFVNGSKLTRSCDGSCNSCKCATAATPGCPTSNKAGCAVTNVTGRCGWV